MAERDQRRPLRMAKEKFVGADAPRDVDAAKPLLIRRGRVESVELYEIKDSELDVFEKGSPADTQLNFAIFLLSIAFAAICTLASATFSDKTIETTFIVAAVVGVLLGLYFLVSWWRTHSSIKDVCTRIRHRIPPTIPVAPEEPDDLAEPDEPAPPPQG
jgi:hypothetical protein